ncbi:DUF3226 domain-containing protein [Flavobacterium sp. C3NV]|uniref:DUF3226 domain-containing protein n=1 Tax=Flavobacterium sp. C3NV TaxID=3393358 RepID=UPI00398FEAC1
MKKYDLNKIFVEGNSDKLFLDFLLKSFFKIDDKDLVVDVKGKDKLIDQPLLIDARRKDERAKNLIIFDTDSTRINGGRTNRLKELNDIQQNLETKFEIYLLPFNDENEGILENLLDSCINSNFNFFDPCWNGMIDCIKMSNKENLNIPAQKAFIYSKIDLFKNQRSIKWDYKGATTYNYADNEIWEIDPNKNKEIKKLLDFINDNLFND